MLSTQDQPNFDNVASSIKPPDNEKTSNYANSILQNHLNDSINPFEQSPKPTNKYSKKKTNLSKYLSHRLNQDSARGKNDPKNQAILGAEVSIMSSYESEKQFLTARKNMNKSKNALNPYQDILSQTMSKTNRSFKSTERFNNSRARKKVDLGRINSLFEDAGQREERRRHL